MGFARDLGSLTALQSVAVWAGLTAACAFFSLKVLGLRGSLGLAASGSMLSLGAYLGGLAVPSFASYARSLWMSLDFSGAVSHGALGILLFAGAMRFDLRALKGRGLRVLALSTLGVCASAGIFALLMRWAAAELGAGIPLPWLLVFGALISPTDPVAVLASLRSSKAPRALGAEIAAESLFNDAMAIALFSVCLAWAAGGGAPGIRSAGESFARQAGGGLAFGACCGAAAHWVLRSIDDAAIETAITIAMALCVYSASESLGVSAPLAAVVCGLAVGRCRHTSASPKTEAMLFPFWETLEEVLTLSLFAMAGLSIMGARLDGLGIELGAASVMAGICSRLGSVCLSTGSLPSSGAKGAAVAVMTWGGVRGVVSIALAMSLPLSPWRDLIVSCSWFVVMFGLLAQAPSVPALLRRRGLAGAERFHVAYDKRRRGFSRRAGQESRRKGGEQADGSAQVAALLRPKPPSRRAGGAGLV